MSTTIRVAAAAEVDLIVAAEWYDRQVPGLGDSFVEQVGAIFERVAEHPEMYQVVYAPIRRAVLHRFPFAVIYRLRNGFIEVLGIMPCRADPLLMKQRAEDASYRAMADDEQREDEADEWSEAHLPVVPDDQSW